MQTSRDPNDDRIESLRQTTSLFDDLALAKRLNLVAAQLKKTFPSQSQLSMYPASIQDQMTANLSCLTSCERGERHAAIIGNAKPDFRIQCYLFSPSCFKRDTATSIILDLQINVVNDEVCVNDGVVNFQLCVKRAK